jgi:hypothetical protein
MLYNRCTGIYKFGNNTPSAHKTQVEFRSQFSGKKVRLMGREIGTFSNATGSIIKLTQFPISDDRAIVFAFKCEFWKNCISFGALKQDQSHGKTEQVDDALPTVVLNVTATDACHRAMLTREHRSLGQRRGFSTEGELFRELPVSWEFLMIGWIKNGGLNNTSEFFLGASSPLCCNITSRSTIRP